MAKYKKEKQGGFLRLPSLPELNLEPEVKKGILVVFIMALGAIGFLSLFDMAGLLGQYYRAGLEYLFGWGKIIFPAVLLGLGYFLYYEEKYEVRGANYLGLAIFSVFILALLQLFVPATEWEIGLELGRGGGHFGHAVASGLVKLLGMWAALIIILSLLLVSFMLMFNASISRLIGRRSWFGKAFSFAFVRLFRRNGHNGDEEDDDGENAEEEEENEEGDDNEESDEENQEEEEDMEDRESDDNEDSKEDDSDPEDNEENERNAKKAPVGFTTKKIATGPTASNMYIWQPTDVHIDLPIELLPQKNGKPKSGDVKKNMEIIAKTLADFGISVEMGDYCVGPTVTQYTFKPAEGIKLTRITALNNDLALALASHPIRIEAPIPGKSLVGIEVPNQTKAIVGLREILESKEFKEKKSSLTVALGKDVAGKVWVGDIAKMPHLLVAGATGKGKSVCLNSIIISLLYQNNPDDLRLIMVDPKRVELTLYNGIPYLLTPVITEMPKTVNALKWTLGEMDRRYNLMAARGKKSIDTYNASTPKKLPFLIFIIDELADLMMTHGRDVEPLITRLLSMARAVGIHLVLATQRPSVDVITGLIKANMPARIAFAVASQTDSRTIIDSAGAEKLLGSGDMLYTASEVTKPKRIQGAFVSETEIKRIVRTIKEEADEPCYLEGITDKQRAGGAAGGSGFTSGFDSDDDMFDDAMELVVTSQKASTSFMQRKMGIGYGRAAKLLDALAEAGIVSEASGPKGREVLMTREHFERMRNGQTVSAMPIHRREESKPPASYLDEDEEDDNGEDGDEESLDDGDEDSREAEKGIDEDPEEESDEEAEEEIGKPKTAMTSAGKDFEDDGMYFSK